MNAGPMTTSKEPERAPDPLRDTLAFVFAHWGRQRLLAVTLGVGISVQTVAEVLSPVFAGQLIDAIASAVTDREAGLTAALHALAAITGLSLFVLVVRHFLFNGIVLFTLNMMGTIAREAFWRVQRFSTDWHANAFAGSTVRKISRGMWALDLLTTRCSWRCWPSRSRARRGHHPVRLALAGDGPRRGHRQPDVHRGHGGAGAALRGAGGTPLQPVGQPARRLARRRHRLQRRGEGLRGREPRGPAPRPHRRALAGAHRRHLEPLHHQRHRAERHDAGVAARRARPGDMAVVAGRGDTGRRGLCADHLHAGERLSARRGHAHPQLPALHQRSGRAGGFPRRAARRRGPRRRKADRRRARPHRLRQRHLPLSGAADGTSTIAFR